MEPRYTGIFSETRFHYWRRVLRPLFWWVLLVLVLYGIRTHQRLMAQTRIKFGTVLKGHNVTIEVEAKLDAKPVYPGQNISLGSHVLSVSHPKAESFTTNFFAWYGENNVGEIELKRSEGTLSIQAIPPATTIDIMGPEFKTTLHDSPGTNLIVPTDQYEIRVQYPHSFQSNTLTVFKNLTATCVFSPHFGALNLACNLEGAKYQLFSVDGQTTDGGNLPRTVTGLSPGNYHVTVVYHHRQIQKTVAVTENVTNEITFEFLLGAVRIESTPVGATVSSADGKALGQTPLDLGDLPPQTAKFQVSLSGYEPASVVLEIIANQTNTFQTNLINSRYVAAMRNARQYLDAGNFEEVIRASGEALSARPEDVEALAMQTSARGHLSAEQQRLQRLKRPQEAFKLFCEKHPDARLFQAHELTTTKPAKDVEAAIAKSLTNSPMGFQIISDGAVDKDVYQIVARYSFSLGILGGIQRDCLIVVGQAKEDETQIYFEVLEYQVQYVLDATTLFNAKENKRRVPLHSSRIQMTDAMQKQIQEGVRIVTERIEIAL